MRGIPSCGKFQSKFPSDSLRRMQERAIYPTGAGAVPLHYGAHNGAVPHRGRFYRVKSRTLPLQDRPGKGSCRLGCSAPTLLKVARALASLAFASPSRSGIHPRAPPSPRGLQEVCKPRMLHSDSAIGTLRRYGHLDGVHRYQFCTARLYYDCILPVICEGWEAYVRVPRLRFGPIGKIARVDRSPDPVGA